MGHLKMKPVGAPIIPAPTKLSLRMTPDGSSGRLQLGAAGDTITGGLSCVPFLSLGMPSFVETPEGVTFRYVLPVNEETETCGECIEWVLTELYDAVESGAEEPEVTIIAADDCRGLIVDITFPEGYESIYQYWVFAVRPFINGHRFGFDTGFGVEIYGPPLGYCYEFSGDGAPLPYEGYWEYPYEADFDIEIVYTGELDGTFAWNYFEVGGAPSDPVSIVEDTDGEGRPRLSLSYSYLGGDSLNDVGWWLFTDPTIDGNGVACGSAPQVVGVGS